MFFLFDFLIFQILANSSSIDSLPLSSFQYLTFYFSVIPSPFLARMYFSVSDEESLLFELNKLFLLPESFSEIFVKQTDFASIQYNSIDDSDPSYRSNSPRGSIFDLWFGFNDYDSVRSPTQFCKKNIDE